MPRFTLDIDTNAHGRQRTQPECDAPLAGAPCADSDTSPDITAWRDNWDRLAVFGEPDDDGDYHDGLLIWMMRVCRDRLVADGLHGVTPRSVLGYALGTYLSTLEAQAEQNEKDMLNIVSAYAMGLKLAGLEQNRANVLAMVRGELTDSGGNDSGDIESLAVIERHPNRFDEALAECDIDT